MKRGTKSGIGSQCSLMQLEANTPRLLDRIPANIVYDLPFVAFLSQIPIMPKSGCDKKPRAAAANQ